MGVTQYAGIRIDNQILIDSNHERVQTNRIAEQEGTGVFFLKIYKEIVCNVLMTNWKVIGMIIGAFVVVSFFFYIGFQSEEITSTEEVISDTEYKENTKSVEEPKETIIFSFSVYPTGEILNGEVIVNNKSLGSTEEGNLTILKNELLDTKEFTFKMKYNNYPYVFFYEFKPKEYLEYGYIPFVVEKYLLIEYFPEDLKSLIRPEEAKPYLEVISRRSDFENNSIEDMKKLTEYLTNIKYREDRSLYGKNDYWATPEETLSKWQGDCEDWAIAFVSLAKAYDPSIKCYALSLSTHMTAFCYLGDGDYVITDQENTWLKRRVHEEYIEQEKKTAVRELLNAHFNTYGIKPSESKIYFVFNDKEEVWFNDNEEFVDWALHLM